MRLKGLDLNLLLVLDTLLQECNVSRAAQRLGLASRRSVRRWPGCVSISTTTCWSKEARACSPRRSARNSGRSSANG